MAAWHVSGWLTYGVLLLPHQPGQQSGAVENAIGRLELALLPGPAALMVFFTAATRLYLTAVRSKPVQPSKTSTISHYCGNYASRSDSIEHD